MTSVLRTTTASIPVTGFLAASTSFTPVLCHENVIASTALWPRSALSWHHQNGPRCEGEKCPPPARKGYGQGKTEPDGPAQEKGDGS